MEDKIEIRLAMSAYDLRNKTIYLSWHKDWTEEEAFMTLVNDVDHEYLHKILDELEGISASRSLDRTLLQVEQEIGFPPDALANLLIEKGFGEKLADLIERWSGAK